MTIGQKIRELREEKGLLQRELALELEIGDGFLSKVENDQKTIKREHLEKISYLFNYPIADLETLWLGTKIYEMIRSEKDALDALKVAEEKIKYGK